MKQEHCWVGIGPQMQLRRRALTAQDPAIHIGILIAFEEWKATVGSSAGDHATKANILFRYINGRRISKVLEESFK